MLTSKPITKLVFLDIETKAKYENFTDLPAKLQMLFQQQWEWLIEQIAHREYLDKLHIAKDKEDYELCFNKAQDEVYKQKAHLSPELSEVICISAGMILEGENKELTFKCASFCGENEKEILTAFMSNPKSFIHQKDYANNEKYIVGYNIKGFDLPFLSKRIIYNGLELPPTLDIGHLKPWELGHIIDLKEHLKFGGMDAPSLELLCTTLGVETAQDKFVVEPSELAGKHKAKEYDFIKSYCEWNVYALAKCYLQLIRSKEYPNGVQNNLTKI